MRRLYACVLVVLIAAASATSADAQSKRPAAKTTKKPPAPPPPPTRAEPQMRCPTELGVGVKTRRQFCDVLTGRDPKEGVLITIPPHRGPVTLTFDLHNRHTYSEELIKAKRAYRHYSATVGVLTLDNHLIDRAVIISDFRAAPDLFDRIAGGAGGAVKAVAPTGVESITIELPEDVGEQVSVLGEMLKVKRPDGDDNFIAPGRPIATISNVMIEFRPGPVPKKKP